MRPIVQLNLPATEVEPINRARMRAVESLNREAEWLALVPQARGRSGTSMTAAAIDMGISLQLYSAQEAGGEGKHLSFRRMLGLGPRVWSELIELIRAFFQLPPSGLTAEELEDLRVGRLVRSVGFAVNPGFVGRPAGGR